MKFFCKKIITPLLILSMVFPSVLLVIPQKAEAQWAVFDASNVVQSTITAANTTVSSFSNMSLQLKAFVLDTLATTLAKMLIRSITASVVNWINSGFEGSPSFLQNPGSFFLDVADQVTGAFLAQNNGPLNSLCSPFSIDIRIALAFKYHRKDQKRYQCTLGTIIRNSRNAVDNATLNGRSIKGFIGGDFNQGGWPAFVTLTQDSQNNVYGAYLQADSELSFRVANAQGKKKDEIGAGKGFLSFRNRSCVREVRATQAQEAAARLDPGSETDEGRAANEALEQYDFENEYNSVPQTIDDCPIETPGSVIESTLTGSTNGPMTELGLVDSINEIVGALAAQLVTRMLQGGLTALSGSGPSDSSSYLRQVQAEAENTSGTQLRQVRANFLQNIEVYIANTLEYKNNKERSLSLVLDTIAMYETAKQCYAAKIANAAINNLTQADITAAQNQIAAINTIIDRDLRPIGNELLVTASTTQARYDQLVQFRNQANSAQTINDINQPSQQLSELLIARNLISAQDIAQAQGEYSSLVTSTAAQQNDARMRLQQCQLFPNGGIITR